MQHWGRIATCVERVELRITHVCHVRCGPNRDKCPIPTSDADHFASARAARECASQRREWNTVKQPTNGVEQRQAIHFSIRGSKSGPITS